MLDIGWSELLLIGVVALIVVGPRDLPRMFRALGMVAGKARAMAREFQRAMEDAAKSSGLDEVKSQVSSIARLEEAAHKFNKWDPKSVLNPAKAAADAPEVDPVVAEATKRAEFLAARAKTTAEQADKFAAKAAELAGSSSAAPAAGGTVTTPVAEASVAPKPKAPPRKKAAATDVPASADTPAAPPKPRKTPVRKPAAAKAETPKQEG